jgi:hypothetical protein
MPIISTDLRFYNGTKDILVIQQGGNVGIGTTSPNNTLDVQGGNLSVNSGTAPNTYPSILELGGNTTGFDVLEASSISLVTINKGGWANVEIVGNVGIGTNAPINDTGYSTLTLDNGTHGGEIFLSKLGTVYGDIWADSTSMGILQPQNEPIRFFTSNNEQMRITGAGNVGLGTTSPTMPLQVVKNLTSSSGMVTANSLNGPDVYPGISSQITATANLDGNGGITGILGSVDQPASNTAETQGSVGVEGLFTNESTTGNNWQSAGIDGEAYNSGTMINEIVGVNGFAENTGTLSDDLGYRCNRRQFHGGE